MKKKIIMLNRNLSNKMSKVDDKIILKKTSIKIEMENIKIKGN